MASPVSTSNKKTSKPNTQLPLLKNNIYTMVAAFAGVVFGVLGSLGFVGSYLHTEFANQTASLNHELVSMRPADDVMSTCTGTSGSGSSSGKPAGLTAAKVSSSNAPAGSNGNNGSNGSNGSSSGGTQFVSKLVSGIYAPGNSTISNTGPHSNNTITTTNTNTTTVTNENELHSTNVNLQSAHSGSASAKDNTTAGSTQSGNASNENSNSVTYNVNN